MLQRWVIVYVQIGLNPNVVFICKVNWKLNGAVIIKDDRIWTDFQLFVFQS